jgi:hypothetical protein
MTTIRHGTSTAYVKHTGAGARSAAPGTRARAAATPRMSVVSGPPDPHEILRPEIIDHERAHPLGSDDPTRRTEHVALQHLLSVPHPRQLLQAIWMADARMFR